MRDAVFTLASGLHEILEGNNAEKGKVNGQHLYKTIQKNGFAHGITGNINFRSDSPNRDFAEMDYTVLNFQQDRFVRVGSIVTAEDSFADCMSNPAYNVTLLGECEQSIFRGLCGLSALIELPSQLY